MSNLSRDSTQFMSILMESVEFAIFYDKLSLFVEKEKLVGSAISKSNKDKFY